MKLKRILILLIMIIIVSGVCTAWNPPPRTIDYKGFAYNNGVAVSDGSVISIWANDGTLKMDEFTLEFGNGYYHELEIVWDDPSTTADEGITYDLVTEEHIIFKLDGNNAQTPSYVTVFSSQEGATIDHDLSFTTAAPSEEEPEPEETPPAKGGGQVSISRCQEKWECSDWEPSECPDSGTQTRDCIDKSGCGTERNKPDTSRTCEFGEELEEVRPTVQIPFVSFIKIPVIVSPMFTFGLIIAAIVLIILIIALWLLRKSLKEELIIAKLLEEIEKHERKEKDNKK